MMPPQSLPVLMHSSSTVGMRRRPKEKLEMIRSTFRSISDSMSGHHRGDCEDVGDCKDAVRPASEAVRFDPVIGYCVQPQGSLARLAATIEVDNLHKLVSIEVSL